MRSMGALLGLIAVTVLVGACSASSASGSPRAATSPSPMPTFAPSPTPNPLPSAVPSATPTAETTAEPTADATAGPLVGRTVTTLADEGLRLRSRPRISDDSFKYEPLLPLDSKLLVLDGPVEASGYDWYEVAPLTTPGLPSGWVASASRSGEPWVEPGGFECPSWPDDLNTLASMPVGVGLACFAGLPITVEARLIPCNCDIDGDWYTPGWFGFGGGSPDLLIGPDEAAVPAATEDWFVVHLDPKGDFPDPLPLDQVVEVTGVFDHPAGSNCTYTEIDGDPAPSQGCRLQFAVVHIERTEP